MDEVQRLIYTLMARIRLQELRGQAFEDFFADVGERTYPGDFVRVRAAGKTGDKKCDGYVQSKARVYACYAPRGMTPKNLQKKVSDDFTGACVNWPDVKEWVFVHNDTDGLDAGTLALLESIRKDNPKLAIDILPPLGIITMILGLSKDQLTQMFGSAASTAEMVRYGYPEIATVVDKLSHAVISRDTKTSIIAPSTKKLTHNNLGSEVAELLRKGEFKAREFQNFFAETTNELQGEAIANWFRERFETLENDGLDASHIFQQLLQDAGGLIRPVNEQAAVLGLLSYLFHGCDIFRDVE